MITRLKRMLFEGETLRLMGLTALTKPLGMIVQILIASYYGASAEYDSYILAFFLVNTINEAFGRVFAAVVIPYLSRLNEKMPVLQLLRLKNAVLFFFLLPSFIYTLMLAFFGDSALALVGRNAPMGTRELALDMVRWMAAGGMLLLLVVTGRSLLNAYHSFRVPAMMPLLRSVTIIVTLKWMHEEYGIWALPISFVIAQVVQVFVLYFYAFRKKILSPVRAEFPVGAPSELWGLSWMVMISISLQAVNGFLDKMFASGLEPGSISSIAYSMTIQAFGMQLFTMSLVTVMFTRISQMFASGDIVGSNKYITNNMVLMSRILVPASLGLAIASEEIVTVLFARGAFSAEDVLRTSGALRFFLLALPALVVNAAIARVFHSLQRMRDKMWLSLQYLLTNLVGNILLIGPLKVMGLALSSAIAINVHLALSFFVLHRYKTGLNVGNYAAIHGRSYLLGLIVWLAYEYLGISSELESLMTMADKWSAFGIGAAKFAFVSIGFGLLLISDKGRRQLLAKM